MVRLDLSRLEMHADPYPIGLARDVFAPDMYEDLLAVWPPEDVYTVMRGGYNKRSLSERNNPAIYSLVVSKTSAWRAFHAWVKTQMIGDVSALLAERGIKLPTARLSARFEFSSMPADGGFIAPHTDIASKLVTLVVPMVRPGEWREEWGGGTDALRPLDPTATLKDYQAPLKEFSVERTMPFAPNVCTVFLKSATSWHSVGPIKGPADVWRRSLTINVEGYA